MKVSRRFPLVALAMLVGALVAVEPLSAQMKPKADDLIGMWQQVSSKDMKTGVSTPIVGTFWLQFTKSHWMRMERVPGEDFKVIPADAPTSARDAWVWNAKGQLIFRSIGGTYKLEGDALHWVGTIAVIPNPIGIERILRIRRLDKTTLVGETEYPDQPDNHTELTYRRVD